MRIVMHAWGYTLVPTVVWFLTTSLLSVALPPPRTTRMEGIVFSLIYLVFSAVLFYWKLTLGYLTVRFGMRLDMLRIVRVGFVLALFIGIYSYCMYRLSVFTIPFV